MNFLKDCMEIKKVDLKYELVWTNVIEEDIRELKIPIDSFLNLKSRLMSDYFLKYPLNKTNRIINVPENIRYIKFGDYRLFIFINEDNLTVYCLRLIHRKECYSKKSINNLLTIIEELRNLK